MTEVGRLFQMAGTAELKARPLTHAVLVRGAWSIEDGWMNVMSLSLMNQSADWRLADEGIQVEKWTIGLS